MKKVIKIKMSLKQEEVEVLLTSHRKGSSSCTGAGGQETGGYERRKKGVL